MNNQNEQCNKLTVMEHFGYICGNGVETDSTRDGVVIPVGTCPLGRDCCTAASTEQVNSKINLVIEEGQL